MRTTTYREVSNSIASRCGNDGVSQLHGEVLSTEARSLEAHGLKLRERANVTELSSKTRGLRQRRPGG
jgi:hypothetical protein